MIFNPCKYALELLMASIFDLTSKNPINAILTRREIIKKEGVVIYVTRLQEVEYKGVCYHLSVLVTLLIRRRVPFYLDIN
jgi:hypothetical protein